MRMKTIFSTLTGGTASWMAMRMEPAFVQVPEEIYLNVVSKLQLVRLTLELLLIQHPLFSHTL